MSILNLLDARVAAEVQALVLQRLASGHHGAALVGQKPLDAEKRVLAKYALMEIRRMNPLEELSDPETALLRGISLSTFKLEKSARYSA